MTPPSDFRMRHGAKKVESAFFYSLFYANHAQLDFFKLLVDAAFDGRIQLDVNLDCSLDGIPLLHAGYHLDSECLRKQVPHNFDTVRWSCSIFCDSATIITYVYNNNRAYQCIKK